MEEEAELARLRTVARSGFPAFDPDVDNPIFMENAGGSQAARCVVEAVQDYMECCYVQLGAGYELSNTATAIVDSAHDAVRTMMGAGESGSIILGPSASQLYANVADAYRRARAVGLGDDIIVQESGHESHIGPWVRLAEDTGARLLWWRFDRRPPFSSPLADLHALLSDRTRIVALAHVSNLLGEVVDLDNLMFTIRNGPNGNRTRVAVDGVAYAPHLTMSVLQWGIDWYGFSLYKTYGPHVAALYGSDAAMKEVITGAPNHYFVPREDPVYRFELGGVAHELAAGVSALPAYFYLLTGRIESEDGKLERGVVIEAMKDMELMEQPLQQLLLSYLETKKGITVVGPPKAEAGERVPTVSFVSRRYRSAAIVRALQQRGFAVRNGHAYAHRLVTGLKAAGVVRDVDDGVVRISMLHYNTVAEVEKLVTALAEVLAEGGLCGEPGVDDVEEDRMLMCGEPGVDDMEEDRILRALIAREKVAANSGKTEEKTSSVSVSSNQP